MARSKNPKPVEGESEIDLVITGKTYLTFVEAKLGSDVSMFTTYDPSRNQIIRNIDVLLDQCDEKIPYFLMFVKDKGPGRAYTQLMDLYRNDPTALQSALPHRDVSTLESITRSMTIILWQDLLELCSEGEEAVIAELKHRVS